MISGIALIVSIFDLVPLPFDASWAAIILCGIPIILEAVIGLVTAFDIKADVLVLLALIASVCIGEDFAAGEVAFIMQLGGLLEELTVARARAGIEKLVHIRAYQAAGVITGGKETAVPAEAVKVGIAMGGVGSDIAVDAADIALVDDEVTELPHLIALSKRMMRTIKLNITFSLTLNFIGDDGELYSHRHTTDENGCIHFKGSTRGEYRAAFSYFPGTASDCFHSFRLDSGDEAPIIMTVEPLAKEFRSAIVITGMLADAKGSDTNNEYIQFMALEEIDFAQTPYCVIACRNNKVNAKGWVQGSYVTYKFNLTSGRAAKGTFFYVGGVNKRLNGNSSADISGANWICSVDYNTQAGADGIGDKTTGFLHNYNSNGNKNIADGIAVFKGTEVDEKSVPCDAVFYGATITTDVYNPAGYGYRIPDNDLYSTKNLLSGVGQPFFGQGTNTFLFPDGGNDAGEFVFFGGSFTQGGYYRGRSAVCRKLAADASGSLADIESGDGVTTYL